MHFEWIKLLKVNLFFKYYITYEYLSIYFIKFIIKFTFLIVLFLILFIK